jgi:hypothetical protein
MKVYEILDHTIIRMDENYPIKVTADWVIRYVAEMNDREDPYEGEVPEHISEFTSYVLREVPIDEINVGDFSYDPKLAAEYANGSRDTAPPIVYDVMNHLVIDGFHRVHAARLRGDQYISAYIGVR